MTKKERLIEALRVNEGDVDATYADLKDRVGTVKQLRWTRNVSGTRVPLPLHEQHECLKRDLHKYAKGMGFAGAGAGANPDAGSGEDGEPATGGDPREGESASGGSAADRAAKAREKADKAAEGAKAASDRYDDAFDAELSARERLGEIEDPAEFDDAAADLVKAREAREEAEQAKEDARKDAAEAEEEAEKAEEEAEKAKAEEFPNEVARFLSECKRLRAFVKDRGDFDAFDSMRIEEDGLKAMLDGGVHKADALLASLTATWPEETRQQANVTDYNYAEFGEADEGVHSAAPYVLSLLRGNLPVWLHGPAGTGKSTCARYAAKALDLPYYEVNLSGSLPSAVKGRDRLKEFVPSEFTEAYRNGGVMCLEEFDFAPPQTAAAINNAIANGHFHNDAAAEVIERHPDFRVVATANTLGTGATREFQRNRLDGATLDRFRMGRVYVGRDERLATTAMNRRLEAAGLDLRV